MLKPQHPSQEQLFAFRDGETADPGLLEHLAGCPECQQVFDDSRWQLALARLQEAETPPAGRHLERDEIAGYMDHALSRRAQLVVERHLESCRRCTIVYRRLRDAQERVRYSSPPVPLMRSVKREFTPRPGTRLGTLILLHLGQRLRWLFQPEDEPEDHLACRLNYELDETASIQPESSEPMHPSSARSRRDRFRQHPAYELLSDADELTLSSSSRRFARREHGQPGEESIRVTAGEWSLTVRSGGPDRIRVHVAERRSNRPLEGVALSLIPERGPSADTETNSDGDADLPLLDGPAKLRIGRRSPWTLDLRHGPRP